MLNCSAIYRNKIYPGSLHVSKLLKKGAKSLPHHDNQPLYLSSKTLHTTPAGNALLNGCEKLPDLTLIWPFHFWPSDIVANSLNHLHQTSGLPWWCAILLGGAILKIPMFGFNIYNFRRIQQAFVTSPRQLTHFVFTYLNNLVTKGEVHALKMANDERRFTIFREGMNWEKSMKIQMFSHISYAPLYWLASTHISMFVALHWMNRIQYTPLTSGGLPWCTDLTIADPYMVLPALCVITGLINLYLHPMHWLYPLPKIRARNLLSLSALPALVVSLSLLSALPVDFILYMISANLTACCLNCTIKTPAIHNELGLLSSGESFNRVIPPAAVFEELSKTLDRQTLLLEQKREQSMLSPADDLPQIANKTHKKLISISSSPIQIDVILGNPTSDHHRTDLDESPNFEPKSDKIKPHVNVKKKFQLH